jgi:hypothetical protein
MIMRTTRRRRLTQMVNALALVSAGVVLFMPKLDDLPSPNVAIMLFAPLIESPTAH